MVQVSIRGSSQDLAIIFDLLHCGILNQTESQLSKLILRHSESYRTTRKKHRTKKFSLNHFQGTWKFSVDNTSSAFARLATSDRREEEI